MSYSLIIPIFNEVNSLPELLSQISYLNDNIQVIIVNDGSDDGSDKILSDYNKEIKIIKNNSNYGKGFSIRKGILHAKNKNIILIDGDLEIKIKSIPKLIKLYEKNNNCTLIGRRWKKQGNLNFEINRIGNYLINYLFNLLYNSNLNDVLCCVRIIRSDLIKSLNLKSDKFSIEVETLAKLVHLQENLIEVDVQYNRRGTQEGKKLKAMDAWEIIYAIIKNRFSKN